MKDPLRWPTSAIFAVVVIISLVAATLSSYDPTQTGQYVLTTLASIQAAVFAIVFSIVILGIQLSTSRYSARLADLFRSDAAYKKTVGIFAVSLGIDVAGLLALTHDNIYILRFLVFLAVGFSAASFSVLYFFVDRTLEQTTPEGIIKRVKQELTPHQVISDAEVAENDPSQTDPFLVPVSIIRSAIDDRDLPAATRGLNLIDSQVEELLKDISTDQIEEDTPVGNSLEELSLERLPNIGEKSVGEDLGEAGKETVDTISSIGDTAVKEEHGPIALHTSQGLAKLVANLDFDSTSEMVRKEAMDESADLLKDAADAELWDAAGTGVRILGWRAAQSVVWRSPTESFNRSYTSLALRYIPDILEKVVEGVSDDVSNEDIMNGLTIRDGKHASPPEEWALWCCYAAMTEATSAFIRYELKHDKRIVNWMSADSGWTSCIFTLNDSDFDSLLKYWMGTILYLEYVHFVIGDQYMDGFHPLARFRMPREVVDQTIEDILNNRLDPTSRIDLLPGQGDPVKAPLTGQPRPLVSDSDQSFEEWLRFHKGLSRRRGD